ncbi:orotate phosphoribosyltransferase [Lactovum miscens]|uniref:Orotate phosphoribosyltransferase n=1 Tax=Lactovum miscens TaxID=190387 RepID=A0A841C5I0_9LACT|nr:orotate phosphoribosyltransferase [Lactovum miscens]MBB5887527.1 orotate phosphoribosyltransferase [Lactovum miscens]
MTDLAKTIGKNLLDIRAVFLSPNEPFTWASGIQSPIYTDNRITLSYPQIRRQIAQGLAQIIKDNFPEVEVIAGTATAGIPHAAWVAEILDLPMIYVRSKPKDHGKGNQVEGRIEEGQKIVLIEDLISTGGSVLEAAAAAEKEGVTVLGIAAIFSYELSSAIENFEKANLKLMTLSNFSSLIEQALESDYISKDEFKLLERFKKDQKNWQ